jgi:hypothetical protein
MATGQYPQRVTVRKHDYLKGVAESHATLAESLRERRQEDADRLSDLRGKVEECTNYIRKRAPPGEVMAQLEGVAKQISSLKQGLLEGGRPGERGSDCFRPHLIGIVP